MLYKQIEKWRDVFKDNIFGLLENIDPYHPAIQSLYEKRFRNEFANIVYSVEEYYKIFEDGDEFKVTKSGKHLDDAVDEHLDELRDLIVKFKERLMNE